MFRLIQSIKNSCSIDDENEMNDSEDEIVDDIEDEGVYDICNIIDCFNQININNENEEQFNNYIELKNDYLRAVNYISIIECQILPNVINYNEISDFVDEINSQLKLYQNKICFDPENEMYFNLSQKNKDRLTKIQTMINIFFDIYDAVYHMNGKFGLRSNLEYIQIIYKNILKIVSN